MRCKCQHSDVCKFKDNLQEAFRGILELHIGGRNPQCADVDALIRRVCRWRIPSSKDASVTDLILNVNKVINGAEILQSRGE